MVGVGNAYRGDDGVGLAVAERLRGRVPGGVEVVTCEQEASRLIDAWEGRDGAVLVDAVVLRRAAPGTVHRFDASDRAGPGARRSARRRTRSASARRSSSRARSGKLPGRVVVYGVEGAGVRGGRSCAVVEAAVAAAVEPAAERRPEEEPCTSAR